MSKPYIPRAGSLTERLLGALAGSGDAMTTADICQLFKVKSNSLFNLLSPAVKAGMLVKGTNAEGRLIYSLPDGDAPTTAAPKARKAAKKKQRVPTAEAATAEPDVDEVPPPIAALFEDGDIALYGITPHADGSGCTLSEPQARRVHRFLERVFGPTE